MEIFDYKPQDIVYFRIYRYDKYCNLFGKGIFLHYTIDKGQVYLSVQIQEPFIPAEMALLKITPAEILSKAQYLEYKITDAQST